MLVGINSVHSFTLGLFSTCETNLLILFVLRVSQLHQRSLVYFQAVILNQFLVCLVLCPKDYTFATVQLAKWLLRHMLSLCRYKA